MAKNFMIKIIAGFVYDFFLKPKNGEKMFNIG